MPPIYLLFYDTDNGSREEWNHNYTPCEAFSCPEDREKRIEYLKDVENEDGELYGYEFMRLDVEPMAKDELEKHPDLNEDPPGQWTYSSEYLRPFD